MAQQPPQALLLLLVLMMAAAVPGLANLWLTVTKDTALLAVVGLAVLVLATAFLSGWAATPVGWMPFEFLALVAFGFSGWEGGLYGLQRPNVHFRKFQDALRQGKHLLFVDVAAK